MSTRSFMTYQSSPVFNYAATLYLYYLETCIEDVVEKTCLYQAPKMLAVGVNFETENPICSLFLASVSLGTSKVQHPTSNIQHPTSNIQHPTSNIQHPTSNIQHPTSNIQHPTSNIKHPITNIQYLKSSIQHLAPKTNFDLLCWLNLEVTTVSIYDVLDQ
ncbi:hypothetical protein BT63DRAFT_457445 [Microthyrium microscopicum]|uniref:Uncharacterized protein n=1 Tax=Microthyrium microscopicum TaxID=703497 RepID=A0A6A6U4C4_9PEZI|nr:hypothetical protein BT63DRAFT_457445 [Microthyrium microscopicum]